MERTAVIHFSGICTHITQPPYRVLLADIADRRKYAAIPALRNLPEHTARLIVKKDNVANPGEVFAHRSSLPVVGFDDAWSWRLDGVKVTIEATEPLVGARRPIAAPDWQEVPSLDAHAPLATEGTRPLPDDEILQSRAAAIVPAPDDIQMVPVNFDARSGGTAVRWELGVEEGSQVKVSLTSFDGQLVLRILLNVPAAASPGPVEPLILIENAGTTKDSEYDFLFHYYALWGGVPENARPPRLLGVVEGGAGVGCSNSSYP